jgi:DNA-binding MarR family transcriptional regulator
MNLARLLLEAFRWFDDALRTRLASSGVPQLTTSESMVFPYLDESGTRPALLAKRLGITRQSTQSLVRGLIQKGMVELVDDPNDGRAKQVVLTKLGRRTVPIALATFAELETELASRIGDRNAKQLRTALEADWGRTPDGDA